MAVTVNVGAHKINIQCSNPRQIQEMSLVQDIPSLAIVNVALETLEEHYIQYGWSLRS